MPLQIKFLVPLQIKFSGGCSDWRFHPSHLIAKLPVYQCAKFGALNPRINEMKSDNFNLYQGILLCIKYDS
jgi:hypothetical protein